MTTLSSLVRKSPLIFYVAGVVILFAGIGLPLHDLSKFGYSTTIPLESAAYKTAITELVIRVGSDALYMFANGLIVQVLIAIYDRVSASKAEAAE